VSPEALEGGPIGRVVDGDVVRIVVDTQGLEGSVDLVGHGPDEWTSEQAAAELEQRDTRDDVAPDPGLPPDTVLWARLQSASGRLWGGCVYDTAAIAAARPRGARA